MRLTAVALRRFEGVLAKRRASSSCQPGGLLLLLPLAEAGAGSCETRGPGPGGDALSGESPGEGSSTRPPSTGRGCGVWPGGL